MEKLININELKTLYPDEWVLLGNPIMDESKIDVVSGIPLYHTWAGTKHPAMIKSRWFIQGLSGPPEKSRAFLIGSKNEASIQA